MQTHETVHWLYFNYVSTDPAGRELGKLWELKSYGGDLDYFPKEQPTIQDVDPRTGGVIPNSDTPFTLDENGNVNPRG